MEILGPVEDWAESMKPLIEDGLVDRIQSSFIPAAQHVWEALKTIAEWIFLSKDWIVPLTVAVGTFIARFHMLVGSSIRSMRGSARTTDSSTTNPKVHYSLIGSDPGQFMLC